MLNFNITENVNKSGLNRFESDFRNSLNYQSDDNIVMDNI